MIEQWQVALTGIEHRHPHLPPASPLLFYFFFFEEKIIKGRDRESNPGLSHPKREFYHLTISATELANWIEIKSFKGVFPISFLKILPTFCVEISINAAISLVFPRHWLFSVPFLHVAPPPFNAIVPGNGLCFPTSIPTVSAHGWAWLSDQEKGNPFFLLIFGCYCGLLLAVTCN